MSNDVWKKILEKIKKEHPYYGSLSLKLFWHDGRLVKYEFLKSETTIIKEGENNG